MCDHWMPQITLPLTREQFHQLPRHPAYQYEFLDGKAYLTPNAKHYHALLELTPREVATEVTLRPVARKDWTELIPLFSAAFARTQPYGSLDDVTRLLAAQEALERTRTGGDGPWIEKASFVAVEGERLLGAIFITLLPAGDPCDWNSYHWDQPPPSDAIESRLGRPHLTWIFLDPLHAGRGTGSALLAAAVQALLALGFRELLSTFMIGNDASMLWHWRNGFRLLAHPGSKRWKRQRGQQ